MNDKTKWTKFSPFPSPVKNGYLYAPFGEGVYELKNVKTKELVYVGEGKNTAWRMSSLLPHPQGASGRNNLPLTNYIFKNLQNIHYRTLACINKATAKQIQDQMIANNKYFFN
jgi:hypothetical protein